MKKISSLIIILAFLLSGCFASFQPEETYVVRKPAYVYYDHYHRTKIYLPYRISLTSRYSFVRYIKNYRGRYKAYTRYFTTGRKKIRKSPNRNKRRPPHKKRQQNKKFKKKKSSKH